MMLKLSKKELNALIYQYLIQNDMPHAAFALKNETKLYEKPLFADLAHLVTKGMLYLYMEKHIDNPDEECIYDFSITEPHFCSETEKADYESKITKASNQTLFQDVNECLKAFATSFIQTKTNEEPNTSFAENSTDQVSQHNRLEKSPNEDIQAKVSKNILCRDSVDTETILNNASVSIDTTNVSSIDVTQKGRDNFKETTEQIENSDSTFDSTKNNHTFDEGNRSASNIRHPHSEKSTLSNKTTQDANFVVCDITHPKPNQDVESKNLPGSPKSLPFSPKYIKFTKNKENFTSSRVSNTDSGANFHISESDFTGSFIGTNQEENIEIDNIYDQSLNLPNVNCNHMSQYNQFNLMKCPDKETFTSQKSSYMENVDKNANQKNEKKKQTMNEEYGDIEYTAAVVNKTNQSNQHDLSIQPINLKNNLSLSKNLSMPFNSKEAWLEDSNKNIMKEETDPDFKSMSETLQAEISDFESEKLVSRLQSQAKQQYRGHDDLKSVKKNNLNAGSLFENEKLEKETILTTDLSKSLSDTCLKFDSVNEDQKSFKYTDNENPQNSYSLRKSRISHSNCIKLDKGLSDFYIIDSNCDSESRIVHNTSQKKDRAKIKSTSSIDSGTFESSNNNIKHDSHHQDFLTESMDINKQPLFNVKNSELGLSPNSTATSHLCDNFSAKNRYSLNEPIKNDAIYSQDIISLKSTKNNYKAIGNTLLETPQTVGRSCLGVWEGRVDSGISCKISIPNMDSISNTNDLESEGTFEPFSLENKPTKDFRFGRISASINNSEIVNDGSISYGEIIEPKTPTTAHDGSNEAFKIAVRSRNVDNQSSSEKFCNNKVSTINNVFIKDLDSHHLKTQILNFIEDKPIQALKPDFPLDISFKNKDFRENVSSRNDSELELHQAAVVLGNLKKDNTLKNGSTNEGYLPYTKDGNIDTTDHTAHTFFIDPSQKFNSAEEKSKIQDTKEKDSTFLCSLILDKNYVLALKSHGVEDRKAGSPPFTIKSKRFSTRRCSNKSECISLEKINDCPINKKSAVGFSNITDVSSKDFSGDSVGEFGQKNLIDNSSIMSDISGDTKNMFSENKSFPKNKHQIDNFYRKCYNAVGSLSEMYAQNTTTNDWDSSAEGCENLKGCFDKKIVSPYIFNLNVDNLKCFENSLDFPNKNHHLSDAQLHIDNWKTRSTENNDDSSFINKYKKNAWIFSEQNENHYDIIHSDVKKSSKTVNGEKSSRPYAETPRSKKNMCKTYHRITLLASKNNQDQADYNENNHDPNDNLVPLNKTAFDHDNFCQQIKYLPDDPKKRTTVFLDHLKVVHSDNFDAKTDVESLDNKNKNSLSSMKICTDPNDFRKISVDNSFNSNNLYSDDSQCKVLTKYSHTPINIYLNGSRSCANLIDPKNFFTLDELSNLKLDIVKSGLDNPDSFKLVDTDNLPNIAYLRIYKYWMDRKLQTSRKNSNTPESIFNDNDRAVIDSSKYLKLKSLSLPTNNGCIKLPDNSSNFKLYNDFSKNSGPFSTRLHLRSPQRREISKDILSGLITHSIESKDYESQNSYENGPPELINQLKKNFSENRLYRSKNFSDNKFYCTDQYIISDNVDSKNTRSSKSSENQKNIMPYLFLKADYAENGVLKQDNGRFFANSKDEFTETKFSRSHRLLEEPHKNNIEKKERLSNITSLNQCITAGKDLNSPDLFSGSTAADLFKSPDLKSTRYSNKYRCYSSEDLKAKIVCKNIKAIDDNSKNTDFVKNLNDSIEMQEQMESYEDERNKETYLQQEHDLEGSNSAYHFDKNIENHISCPKNLIRDDDVKEPLYEKVVKGARNSLETALTHSTYKDTNYQKYKRKKNLLAATEENKKPILTQKRTSEDYILKNEKNDSLFDSNGSSYQAQGSKSDLTDSKSVLAHTHSNYAITSNKDDKKKNRVRNSKKNIKLLRKILEENNFVTENSHHQENLKSTENSTSKPINSDIFLTNRRSQKKKKFNNELQISKVSRSDTDSKAVPQTNLSDGNCEHEKKFDPSSPSKFCKPEFSKSNCESEYDIHMSNQQIQKAPYHIKSKAQVNILGPFQNTRKVFYEPMESVTQPQKINLADDIAENSLIVVQDKPSTEISPVINNSATFSVSQKDPLPLRNPKNIDNSQESTFCTNDSIKKNQPYKKKRDNVIFDSNRIEGNKQSINRNQKSTINKFDFSSKWNFNEDSSDEDCLLTNKRTNFYDWQFKNKFELENRETYVYSKKCSRLESLQGSNNCIWIKNDLAITNKDGLVTIIHENQNVTVSQIPSEITSIGSNKQGKIAIGTYSGKIWTIDSPHYNSRVKTTNIQHDGPITKILGNPFTNHKDILAISYDGKATLIDNQTKIDLHKKPVTDCAWINESVFITSSEDFNLRLCDISKNEISSYRYHISPINTVTARNNIVASASNQGQIVLFNAINNKNAFLNGHKEAIYFQEWLKGGDTLCSGGSDTICMFWDVQTAKHKHSYRIDKKIYYGQNISTNTVAVCTNQCTIDFIDQRSGVVHTIETASNVVDLKFHADLNRFCACLYDESPVIMDLRIS